ncbi:hypothetical protein KKG31_05235 [Patescibacteria group bacterium]|nr:hypothetical protein [Patescibacteria group bacterium]
MIVHVLSEQITVTLPSVSIDFNFLTNTFFLYIFCTHSAKTIVTTAGNHSGIAETARLIEVNNISKRSSQLIQPKTKTITTIAMMMIHKVIHNFLSLCCRGVVVVSVFCTRSAILPS